MSLLPRGTKLFIWILGIEPGPHVCMTNLLPTNLSPKPWVSGLSKTFIGAEKLVGMSGYERLHKHDGPNSDPQHPHKAQVWASVSATPAQSGAKTERPLALAGQ